MPPTGVTALLLLGAACGPVLHTDPPHPGISTQQRGGSAQHRPLIFPHPEGPPVNGGMVYTPWAKTQHSNSKTPH